MRPRGLNSTLSARLHDRGMETFVIRLWTPAELEDATEPRHLRGIVEQVRVGERRTFRDGSQLLALLRAGLDGRLPDATNNRRSES
jgi:hypothetical protein